MLVRGKEGLNRYNLQKAAEKPCFHCGEELDETDPAFCWVGDTTIVMHIMCFADWMRRAQRDLNKFFGIAK